MVKLKKRKGIVWNIAFFLCLSLVFFHIIQSLDKNISALSWELFRFHLMKAPHVLLLLAGSLYFVFRVMKISKVFLIAYWSTIVLESLLLLFQNYNKLIFVMISIFLMTLSYLYLLWKMELEDPAYNPLFDHNDLDNLPKTIIGAKIQLEGPEEKTFDGVLTNWSDSSCFIKLFETLPPIKGKIRVKIILDFEGRQFCQSGEVISVLLNSRGLGIGLVENPQNQDSTQFSWKEFFSLLNDLGHLPSYLIRP